MLSLTVRWRQRAHGDGVADAPAAQAFPKGAATITPMRGDPAGPGCVDGRLARGTRMEASTAPRRSLLLGLTVTPANDRNAPRRQPWPNRRRRPSAKASNSPTWTRVTRVSQPPRPPRLTASDWRWSNSPLPSVASCSCSGVGQLSDPSLGWPDSAGFCETQTSSHHARRRTLVGFCLPFTRQSL